MSSRNRYLTAQERAQAPALQQALQAARTAWESGVTGSKQLLEIARQHLAQRAPMGRIDYLALVDAETLQPVNVVACSGLIALAVFFGKTRLIDNMELQD